MEEMKVRLTFVSSVLGTAPNNPSIYEEFIYKKDPESEINTLEDEIETLGSDAVVEKGMTVFHKDAEGPFLYSYMIKGFLKEAIAHLRNAGEASAKGMTSYKKKIDGNVQIVPDKLHFKGVDHIGDCQRTLRAQTLQGERTALACSEEIDPGCTVSFLLRYESSAYEKAIRAALDHGLLVGIGQWRGSGGKGKFYWEEIGKNGETVYTSKDKYEADRDLEIDW